MDCGQRESVDCVGTLGRLAFFFQGSLRFFPEEKQVGLVEVLDKTAQGDARAPKLLDIVTQKLSPGRASLAPIGPLTLRAS